MPDLYAVGGRQIGIYPEPEPVRTIFSPGKMWTVDEIDQIFPRTIGRGVKNEWEGIGQAASATTASP